MRVAPQQHYLERQPRNGPSRPDNGKRAENFSRFWNMLNFELFFQPTKFFSGNQAN